MKKIKYITFFALLLVVALVFAGCSSPQGSKEQTAYELVKSASEKNLALDSSQLEISLNMKMSLMGMTIEMPTNYSIKTAKEDGHTIASAVMEMNVMNESIKMDLFVDKDYVYLSENVENIKAKLPITSDLAAGYDVSKMGEDIIKELPEDILKDVQIVKNDDGSKTVNVAIAEDRFNEIFKDYTDAALDSVLSELSDDSGMEIKFSNAKADITVNKDGYVSDYNLSFDMNMKMNVEGITMDLSASVDSTCKYINPGNKITVERPADLDTYTEISGI